MLGKYVFPAVFHPEDIGFSIHFPDLPGCITEGDTLEEASKMARDALELYLYELEQSSEPIPSPTGRYHIEKDEYIVMVTAHMKVIRSEMRNKAVKKTLTIPCWLNEEAEAAGINFSLLLQDALREKLGV